MILPRAHIIAALEQLARIKSGYFIQWEINVCAFRSHGVSMIDGRAQYTKSEKLITGDKYNFMRSVYLQSREFKIRAGNGEDDV